jgi:hypothetical protein
MLYWNSGRLRRHQPLLMQSVSFLSCHPEASEASPKDLVAPPNEVAPSTCIKSDAVGAARPNPRPLPFREGESEFSRDHLPGRTEQQTERSPHHCFSTRATLSANEASPADAISGSPSLKGRGRGLGRTPLNIREHSWKPWKLRGTPPPAGEDARRLSPVRHSARVQPLPQLRQPPSLAKKSERGDAEARRVA